MQHYVTAKAVLSSVRKALLAAKNALESNGFDWLEVVGDNWRFERFNMARIPSGLDRANSIYETVLLPNGEEERKLKGLQLGFASASKGGRLALSNEAFSRSNLQFDLLHEMGHAVNFSHQSNLVSSFNSAYGNASNYFTTYGRDHDQRGERWADAFAVYIFNTGYGVNDSVVIPDPEITSVNWDNIHIAVHNALTVSVDQ